MLTQSEVKALRYEKNRSKVIAKWHKKPLIFSSLLNSNSQSGFCWISFTNSRTSAFPLSHFASVMDLVTSPFSVLMTVPAQGPLSRRLFLLASCAPRYWILDATCRLANHASSRVGAITLKSSTYAHTAAAIIFVTEFHFITNGNDGLKFLAPGRLSMTLSHRKALYGSVVFPRMNSSM